MCISIFISHFAAGDWHLHLNYVLMQSVEQKNYQIYDNWSLQSHYKMGNMIIYDTASFDISLHKIKQYKWMLEIDYQ